MFLPSAPAGHHLFEMAVDPMDDAHLDHVEATLTERQLERQSA
jgi:hypothetical protein